MVWGRFLLLHLCLFLLLFVTYCYPVLAFTSTFIKYSHLGKIKRVKAVTKKLQKVTNFVTISRIVGVDRHFVVRGILKLTINKEARYGRLRVIVRRGAHG